jgi:hypothetical protein
MGEESAKAHRLGGQSVQEALLQAGSHTKYFLVILLVWVYQQECLDRNILNILSKTSEI